MYLQVSGSIVLDFQSFSSTGSQVINGAIFVVHSQITAYAGLLIVVAHISSFSLAICMTEKQGHPIGREDDMVMYEGVSHL